MKAKPFTRSRAVPRGMMAAVVLGTALSAFGPSTVQAAVAPETTTINDISRYCTTCWRNARLHPDFWSDCTQEVFTRLLERVAPASWSQVLRGEGTERREFLRAIDAVKKRTQRSRKAGVLTDDVADDRDRDERVVADSRQTVGLAAAEVLSQRQQQILQMSFEGWSVQEIADRLEVPAERISDDKYKAVRKLRAYLRDRELESNHA